MKFATLKTPEHPHGHLVVVSRDLRSAVSVAHIAPTLLAAIERWADCYDALQHCYDALNERAVPGAFEFNPRTVAAPLPRSPQWCDGSAFLHHGQLMERAFNLAPTPESGSVPLMYQGASDDFLGAYDDVPLPDEAHGIDFEGEFGVVVDRVPLGIAPDEALTRIRLLVQVNDWSLRALGPREMRSGFGFLQAKPSTAFAPVAITPDELGGAWRNGCVHMNLHVAWNGKWFGHAHGGVMDFHFGELIAHAARTRKLGAGTIIGSGTVSNVERTAGSSCIAERRVIEMIDEGQARTRFMRFGDTVRMEARHGVEPGEAPFGTIEQRVVRATPGSA